MRNVQLKSTPSLLARCMFSFLMALIKSNVPHISWTLAATAIYKSISESYITKLTHRGVIYPSQVKKNCFCNTVSLDIPTDEILKQFYCHV